MYFKLLLISLSFLIQFHHSGAARNKLKLKNPSVQELKDVCLNSELEELYIKGSNFDSIPVCLSEMKNLELLSLSHVNIGLKMDGLSLNRSIKELRILHTDIYELPSEIIGMKQLEVLNLGGTDITKLPDGLEHLQKIDMRMIKMNREEQNDIREKYPDITILFSSPCQCG